MRAGCSDPDLVIGGFLLRLKRVFACRFDESDDFIDDPVMPFAFAAAARVDREAFVAAPLQKRLGRDADRARGRSPADRGAG
jgi:hypothetical protein